MKPNEEGKLIHQIIYMMQKMALKNGKKGYIRRAAHANSLGILKGYFKATFDFMVQFQKRGMAIEDLSQEWDEKISPFIKVGEVIIKPQIFDTKKRRVLGEKLTFSPGYTLAEHALVGIINKARVIIYRHIADFRKKRCER